MNCLLQKKGNKGPQQDLIKEAARFRSINGLPEPTFVPYFLQILAQMEMHVALGFLLFSCFLMVDYKIQ